VICLFIGGVYGAYFCVVAAIALVRRLCRDDNWHAMISSRLPRLKFGAMMLLIRFVSIFSERYSKALYRAYLLSLSE
jgi:hypothetical protein